MRDVVLHAFNWKYGWIAGNAKQIAECGFGAVLFPPPVYSEESGSKWWQPYQPKDYRVIRSCLGRKADLVAAIKALNDVGVRSYADIVFNHMANEKETRMKRYGIEGWDKDKLESLVGTSAILPWPQHSRSRISDKPHPGN